MIEAGEGAEERGLEIVQTAPEHIPFEAFLDELVEQTGVGPAYNAAFSQIRTIRESVAARVWQHVADEFECGDDPDQLTDKLTSKQLHALEQVMGGSEAVEMGMTVVRDGKNMAQKAFNELPGTEAHKTLPSNDDRWIDAMIGLYRRGIQTQVDAGAPNAHAVSRIFDGVEAAYVEATEEIADQWLVVKQEEAVVRDAIVGYMTASHENYRDFMAWLEDAHADPDDDELLAIRVLADAVHDATTRDPLEEHAETIETQAHAGSVSAFIDRFTDEGKGGVTGEWVRFIVASGHRDMLLERDNWPDSLNDAYGAEVGRSVTESKRWLRETLGSFKSRRRLNSSPDDALGVFRKEAAQGMGGRKARQRRGRVTPKKVAMDKIEDELPLPERRDMSAALGTLGPDGTIVEGDIDGVAAELMKSRVGTWDGVDEALVKELIAEVMRDPRSSGDQRSWIRGVRGNVKGIHGLDPNYRVKTRAVRPRKHEGDAFTAFPHQTRAMVSVITNRNDGQRFVMFHGLLAHDDQYMTWLRDHVGR